MRMPRNLDIAIAEDRCEDRIPGRCSQREEGWRERLRAPTCHRDRRSDRAYDQQRERCRQQEREGAGRQRDNRGCDAPRRRARYGADLARTRKVAAFDVTQISETPILQLRQSAQHRTHDRLRLAQAERGQPPSRQRERLRASRRQRLAHGFVPGRAG